MKTLGTIIQITQNIMRIVTREASYINTPPNFPYLTKLTTKK